jgi:hypothetical protein
VREEHPLGATVLVTCTLCGRLHRPDRLTDSNPICWACAEQSRLGKKLRLGRPPAERRPKGLRPT